MSKIKTTEHSKEESQEDVFQGRKYIYARGRRKESQAQVRIYQDGQGRIIINKKNFRDYFPYFEFQKIITRPLELVGIKNKADVSIRVKGGGKRGQAEGIRHGLSRALVKMKPDFRKILKKVGFLTRDSRMKERKKYGLKRARKAPQWQKR